MGPYSHIIIADKLIYFLKPDNLNEYYWGTVAPDIRFLIKGMTKKHTHFSGEKISYYLREYPQCRSFLQGYLVHCLTDKIDLQKIIQQRFPFSLVKGRITKKNSADILEYFNIEIVKPSRITLAGKNNPLLRELGISDKITDEYAQSMNEYLNSPTLSSAYRLYQNLGITVSSRIDKYRKIFQKWPNSWFKNNLILIAPQLNKLNKEIAALVKTKIS